MDLALRIIQMTTERRRSVVVAAVAVSLAGCAASTPSITGSPRPATAAPTPIVSPAPSSIVTPAPSPLPEGVLASISLNHGSAPSAIAIGYGSVWVESHRGTFLYRIDPATNTIAAQIDVGQKSCGMPGIAFERVWLMPCSHGTKTMVVDPNTNQVVGSFEGGCCEMAFADGSAWTTPALTLDGTFLRVDPASLKPISTTIVGETPSLSVVGAGFVWVADVNSSVNTYGGTISKVDPTTGRVVASLSTPDPGFSPWLTFAFGHLWLKGTDNPDLLRIDPASGKVTTYTIPGYVPLTQMYDIVPVEGLGSLWMRIADGTVARIDPANGKVLATYPADATGGGGWAAVAFGSLWVANFGTDTVWRVQIKK